ncbi:hypothetical protein [Microvirga sp. BSC39]|uniref:hypothetical protein n=1 Tax=Microvirga sp. BSC39 TaxID=1549810 RepID=UPI00068BD80D|nr:hypothetical protein [Microvirga sp. BSC39]
MTATSPLSSFACLDGQESLVFGQRPDGSIAHISEVPRGIACGCTCPRCGTPLVARKGDVQDHHFGHQGTADGRPCTTAPETALHKFAKELLERRLELFLPTLELTDGQERWIGFEGKNFRFDYALLESRLGTIVPDVVVWKGSRDLIVEFAVAHECGAEKIARIVEMDIGAIEIDLSRLPRDVSREGLEDAILTTANRRWLHNPKLRQGEAELGARRRQKADAVSRGASPLAKAYLAALERLRTSRRPCLPIGRIKADSMEHAIGHEVPGWGCFRVPPCDWQATILADVIEQAVSGHRSYITVKDALRKLKERGWINTRFSRITEVEATALRASKANFDFPDGAISSWAALLSRQSILVPVIGCDRWILHPMIIKEIQARRSLAKQGK